MALALSGVQAVSFRSRPRFLKLTQDLVELLEERPMRRVNILGWRRKRSTGIIGKR